MNGYGKTFAIKSGSNEIPEAKLNGLRALVGATQLRGRVEVE
jgi:hypothetical protein